MILRTTLERQHVAVHRDNPDVWELVRCERGPSCPDEHVYATDDVETVLMACADALAPAPLDPMVEAQLQKEIAGALKERREIYEQAPATDGSEQGRWSYRAQCNASHLADLVQRLSTLRGAPEPKGLTRDDCIALENLCTAKARAVQESSPDDADEFRRLMQKVLRLRADALATQPEIDRLRQENKELREAAVTVAELHMTLRERAEAAEQRLADALAPQRKACPECKHPWHDSYCPVPTSPSEIAAFPHTCGCLAHEDRADALAPAAPMRVRVWQQGFDREDQAKVIVERPDGQPFTRAEAQQIAAQVEASLPAPPSPAKETP